MKIGILGIGGVGGFFGGILAKEYAGKGEHEIIFVSRSSKETIEKNGLELRSTIGDFIVHPDLVTSAAELNGHLDVLFLTTKSYDLESSAQSIAHCLDENSLVIPLLNGVEMDRRVKAILPNAQVANGCVYIVSTIKGPGIIQESGGIQKLSFGSSEPLDFDLDAVQDILRKAGIESKLSNDIELITWNKYVFISSVASLTSYTDLSLGEILESSDHLALMKLLLSEVIALGKAKGVLLSDDLAEKAIQQMKGLPFEATSSMQRDFRAKNITELDALCGFVVKESEMYNLKANSFEKIYQALS